MDGVALRRAGDRAVDAPFTNHGTAVYGYRATRSPGGRNADRGLGESRHPRHAAQRGGVRPGFSM